MPNPSTKLAFLCACTLAGSSAAFAQPGGAGYNPPPKIEPTPLPFRVGSSVAVKASVYKPNLNLGGAHPPVIELRVVQADAAGNFPATGGATYRMPAGSPNWAHWTAANFTNVSAPNVGSGHTLAMVVSFMTWSAVLRRYLVQGGSVNRGSAAFRKTCGRPPAGLCVYRRI